MALSGTLPIIWGLANNRLNDAVWVTLTAEAISWVELKGSFTWRLRTLLACALLAIVFSMLGTLTGNNILLSVLCMLLVGFFATLLKNIGDRASGLALSVYMMYIICNAYPVTGYTQVTERLILVCAGAAWPVLVGLFISLLTPVQQPFRRQIALIWRAISDLVETVSDHVNKSNRDDITGLYLKEKEIRTAIDNSYEFFGRMAHQVNVKDNQNYQLALLRKAAGLVSVNVIAMAEEIELIAISELDEALRVKAASLLGALKEAIGRISVFVITLKPEEKLLAVSHINRMKNLVNLIRQYPMPADKQQTNSILRVLQLSERTIRLLENAIQRIEQMGKDVPVYRSYSLIKTSFLLKPKYFFRNIGGLFNLNSLTMRYALRSAIAASIGLFAYKWFKIDHGYWIPFSLMIVIQPYFGATFKKAADRVTGTLLGGIAGSLFLYIPTGLHIKEAILFISFILMVFFMRRNYAIAAFIITINLILLFNIEASFNNMLMVTRALCTVGGALLAVGSGFALFPAWDKKWLPSHLAEAIKSNYAYFTATFYSDTPLTNWTKFKRIAESENSNVFDSFNRYIQEPGNERSEIYYGLITHNIRITRNINNIHLEEDEKQRQQSQRPNAAQQQKIDECREWFGTVMHLLPKTDTAGKPENFEIKSRQTSAFILNDVQLISLEKLVIELKTMKEDMGKLVDSK